MMLADTMAIAVLTGRKPATVRSWARKGLIERKGTDGRHRALYDVGQAQELARRLDEILVSQNRPALGSSADGIDHGQGACNTQSAREQLCPQADQVSLRGTVSR